MAGAARKRSPSSHRSKAESGQSRSGGRPRDPEIDLLIVKATRDRLVADGYSDMTLGDIAKDAGVTRPTIYRRWSTKLELTIDALDYGFRAQNQLYPSVDFESLAPREAYTEAVRRVDPCYYNPHAMVLMGNFMGESIRTPDLLAIVREHAVEPRVAMVEAVVSSLQERGEVRSDADPRTLATIAFGSYYTAFLRQQDTGDLADRVVAATWPAMAKVD